MKLSTKSMSRWRKERVTFFDSHPQTYLGVRALTLCSALSAITIPLGIGLCIPQPALGQISPEPGSNTTVNLNGNTFDIRDGQTAGTGDNQNLFHSFQQFGLNQNQIANFVANPNIRNILGRVMGGNPSLIDGLIQVTVEGGSGTPNLFLMNPAGMIFGANASLNVPASFTATTATGIGFGNRWFNASGTNDYPLLVGSPNTFAFSNTQPGSIVNAGNLTVQQGNLMLLGGTVINTGQLNAAGNQITVAAVPGEHLMRISQIGNVLSLEVQPLATANTQPGNWTLPVQSLPELLTGGNAGNATGLTVNSEGQVELTGSGLQVDAITGAVTVSGTLDASNRASGQKGGAVQVLGDTVALLDRAGVDVSGDAGGGTALIGGDYQGQGPVPNASQTFVDTNASINADAVHGGNGGKVILWADEATRFYGTISARGGENAGNGGLVEVSGKENLAFNGLVDVGAPAGQNGQLLLDPANITIGVPGTDDDELDDEQILATDSPGAIFTISPTALSLALARGDVTIAATNDITIDNQISALGTGNLTLQAQRDITVNNGERIGVRGNLQLEALRNITLQAGSQLQTDGDLNLQAQGNITSTGSELQADGNLNLQAQGNLILQNSDLRSLGNMQLVAQNQVQLQDSVANPSVTYAGGNLLIQGTEGIAIDTLNHAYNFFSQSVIRSGGNLNLVSDRTITGNARFVSGGDFSTTGTFQSTALNSNGIISSNGNVSFGDYTGSSLKVEARGSIRGGNITITQPGTFPPGTDPDIAILNKGPAVILRAGLTTLQYSPDVSPNQPVGTTPFTFPQGQLPQTATLPGSIEVGNIATGATPVEFPVSGSYSPDYSVILTAAGEIRTGRIQTEDGSVRLTTTGGDILVGSIDTRSSAVSGSRYILGGGNVEIDSAGIFRAQDTFEFTFAGRDGVLPDPPTRNVSILTAVFEGREGVGGTIDIQHRGASFVEQYTPGAIANNASGTLGEVMISGGNNAGLYGSFSDRQLSDSSRIQVTQLSPINPGGGNGGGGNTGGGGSTGGGSTGGGSTGGGDNTSNTGNPGNSDVQIATQVFEQQDEQSSQLRNAKRCRNPQVNEDPDTENKPSDEEECEELPLFEEGSQPRLLRLELPIPAGDSTSPDSSSKDSFPQQKSD